MIRITHILWRPLDGFQIKIHQPFCYFCRTITLLQRFLYETLLELKIWVTWKHGNIKTQLTCLRSSLSAEGECTGWETWDLLSQTKWSWALMWWKWSFGICRRELVSAGCDCTDAFEPCKRKKREECDMFLWWPLPCLSDLSEKTAPLHLGSDRHSKNTEFGKQLSMTGKKTSTY